MRWRLILAIALMTAVGMGSVRAQMDTPAALTVIQAGTVIDGQSDTPRKNQLIFVRGERIEKVVDASAGIPKDAKVVDLSSFTVLPGLIDAHTHLVFVGRRPGQGRIRREYSESGDSVAGGACDVCSKAGAGARIHNHTRSGDGRRGLWRHRDQRGDRGRDDSRTSRFWGYTRNFHYWRIQPGRLRTGVDDAEGRADRRWTSGGAEGNPGTTGARSGLDQGVYDAPVVGGQRGKILFAADADRRGVESNRG